MKRSHILLVEDTPDDVELTRRAFKKNSIANDLVVCRDGEEALDYLFAEGAHAGRDPYDLPAVVLLDLKLPRISGLEVLSRLRSDPRTRLLPIVMLTTSKEERDLAESYRLGCNSYVVKPVDFGQFMDAVKQLGLYWLVLNEIPPPPDRSA